MSNSYCYHCKEPIQNTSIQSNDGHEFCCHGCFSVHEIIKDNGMLKYYKFDRDDIKKPEYKNKNFDYLDQIDFDSEFVQKKNNSKHFQFYVEGIHCAACLWLLEKIPTILPDVYEANLDMSKSVLEVTYSNQLKTSKIAYLINSLGYMPFPVKSETDVENYQKEESKKDLIKIGVSFVCAGNIMLYALSIYLGAPLFFEQYFNIVSFICTIPVVFFCAIPFYKNALGSLKQKKFSIDMPIVTVIIFGFLLGFISLFSSLEYYYFDTITVLVFLLLSSRFALKSINKKLVSIEKVSSFYGDLIAYVKNDKEYTPIHSKYLNKSDIVLVKRGEVVPSDGILKDKIAFLDNSIITGESNTVRVSFDENVSMGAKNLGDDIEVLITESVEKSRMGKVIKSVENGWNKNLKMNVFVDSISRYFNYFLLLLSSLFFFYFTINESLFIAVDRTFSLLLITCPCALALSIPLTFTMGLSSFLKKGVYIKDDSILEKIKNTKNIFFDKTGTLTDGKFELLSSLNQTQIDLIYSIEKNSTHPIGNSLAKQLYSSAKDLGAYNFEEGHEIGAKAHIDNEKYQIRGVNSPSQSKYNKGIKRLELIKNTKTLFKFDIQDTLKNNIDLEIENLKLLKNNVYMLTGDNLERAENIGARIGINKENIFYEQSPEQKNKLLKEQRNSMIIGDGYNDISAMHSADVGVSIGGCVETAIKASDVYISDSNSLPISELILGAKNIYKIVRINLLVSILYNLLGIYLAFSGLVSPVVAAVFMPTSSVTVILITTLSMKYFEKRKNPSYQSNLVRQYMNEDLLKN